MMGLALDHLSHRPSRLLCCQQVHNFPLMKPDERVLRKVMMLRRIEVLDHGLSQEMTTNGGMLRYGRQGLFDVVVASELTIECQLTGWTR